MASSQAPAPKPRPIPRPRNQTNTARIVENEIGKPVVAPSVSMKPVIPPKPRRQPPTYPKMEKSNCTSQTNNNEVVFSKTTTAVKQTVEGRSCESIKTNFHPTATERVDGISNGPESVDDTFATDIPKDQRYEPLRPQTENASSSSDDGYEDISIPPRRKEIPGPTPRADKPSPLLPCKVHGVAGKPLLPPPQSKTGSPESKSSPPSLRKFSSSPPHPSKSTTKRPEERIDPNFDSSRNGSSDGRTLNLNPRDGKPRSLPPKKPLPSLPKVVAPSSVEIVSSKPPIPIKPPSVSAASSQTSVAALAQKLSTMPLFGPYRDSEASNEASVLNLPSLHGSSLTSPVPSQKAFPQGRKVSPDIGSSPRSSEQTNLKVLPKPGNLKSERSQSQPIPIEPRDEIQKQLLPARPSPPSSQALLRVQSRTVESLEDEESQQIDRTTLRSKGFRRKSSHPESHKRKLGSRHKSLVQPGQALTSTQPGQAQRRAPPLPPGAPRVTSLRPPPVPVGPRPRPSSAYEDATRTCSKTVFNKSVSVGDLPRVMTAEEQSEYSYAYEHTYVGPSPPSSVPSVRNTGPVAVNQSDDDYVTPEESVVNEFMEDIQKKTSHGDADHQTAAGLLESLSKTQTLSGFPAEILQSSDEEDSESSGDAHEYLEPPVESDEAGDINRDDDASSENSFSSDSSDGYSVPSENISPPEPPPHSNAYDLSEGIYMEPFQKSSEEVFSSDDDKDSISSEPLYQVYNACTLQRERNLSRRRLSSGSSMNDEASLEELTKGTLRNMRMLWCELPEVKASGILDLVKPEERKRQEAMFEVITSEASYLKSLNVLISHFLNSDELSSGSSLCTLERGQSHVLFSNISSIKSVSESFLQALRARQKEAVVISSISDIIEEHATKYFEVYVKYCSNQIYQDRALKNLRKNMRFIEAVGKLEGNKKAQGLTLQSFLVLPMQRITRLPLLVNAICHRCEPGSDEFRSTDQALAAINKTVRECNEGARKMERMEEMCLLQTQIEFKIKPLALATSTRYLLRRGDLMYVVEDSRSPLKRGRSKLKPLYMFLFNDLLLLAKKKSENRFQAIDYATRNMTQMEEPREPDLNLEHMISLVLLENSDGKTKEFLLVGNSETDKTRWIEAFKPPAAEQEGETVYGSWDCPQVHALHSYTARQPDELSLFEGDVINVLKKLRDGWYHGERLCDGTQGWFPANHTEEILNEHVRARNLRQRYRLLAASKHLIGGTLKL